MSQPTHFLDSNEAGVVVLGGGHAGASAVAALRKFGYEGRIQLVSAEAALPYQRPPLSKEWLCADTNRADFEIRPASFYEKAGIELRLGAQSTAIDARSRKVVLDDGAELTYKHLVYALGACPVVLKVPGAELEGIVGLRDATDAARLKRELANAKHLVVLGGGYIGLEVAASARRLGLQVTVIEKAPRVLARVASPLLSHHFEHEHRQRGVRVLTNQGLAACKGRGRIEAVVLDDGQEIECDCLLVGIGVVPNDALARRAGLVCDSGVIVDGNCCSSDPAIFAIGDCATTRLAPGGELRRFESVPAANDQARRAAAAIAGKPVPAPETPWFWSDQYDIKLQMAGTTSRVDNCVLRGDPASGRFAVFHLAGKSVKAVECVNDAAAFSFGKSLIADQTHVDLVRLADTNISLKSVVASHETT